MFNLPRTEGKLENCSVHLEYNLVGVTTLIVNVKDGVFDKTSDKRVKKRLASLLNCPRQSFYVPSTQLPNNFHT